MVRVLLDSDRGGQPVLLAVDVREELPVSHAAWSYLAEVDRLDLSAFYARYRADGRGHPPYDPAMMLALQLYCASKKIYATRAVEAACIDDLGCRLITGNRRPDHTTIHEFRQVHAEALQGLLPQSLRLCDEAGLVDIGLIAGDGTKVEANAAMPATIDEATLRRRIDTLTTLVTEREATWRATITGDLPDQGTLFDTDTDTDTDVGVGVGARAGRGSDAAWRRLGLARHTLTRHQDALRQLLARPSTEHTDWQDRLANDTARVTQRQQRLAAVRAERAAFAAQRTQREAVGHRTAGARPVPVEDHTHVRKARKALAVAVARAEATAANPPGIGTINITDPASRIMPTKHGGYDQCHNVQATATTRHIILAITRHDSPNDKQALTNLLTATRTNLDTAGIHRDIGVALFDNGYASEDNFTADLPVQTLLIAVQREARQTRRLTDGITTAPTTPAWQTMTDRLNEPANHKHYKRRGATIEPVFAQLFNHFGHRLTLRGDHTDTELHLWATSHNLAKLIRHRQHTTPTPTQARGNHPHPPG